MKKSRKDKNEDPETDSKKVSSETQSNEEVSEQEGKKGEKNLEQEVSELNDKFLRLYSEFDNYRKRTAREKLDLMKSASADLLTELLPVVDDFDRTILSIESAEGKETEALLEGVKLVQHKFIHVLTKQGLIAFDAMGQPFDPDFHEAITKIPAPSEELKGKVVDVIEKGYMLNEKVLRYAKVVVGE